MSDLTNPGMGRIPPVAPAPEPAPHAAAQASLQAESAKSGPAPQKVEAAAAETTDLAQKYRKQASEPQTPEQTVELANKVIEAFSTSIRFMVDEKEKLNVLMYDSNTGQVIRRLPTATLSQMLNKVETLMGVLFDFRA